MGKTTEVITVKLTKAQAYALKMLDSQLNTLEMQGVLADEDVAAISEISAQIRWEDTREK